MFKRIDKFLITLSKFSIVLLSIFLVFGLGLIDYFIGSKISFSVFYVIPIAVSTWYVGRKSGIFISVVSSLIWLVADITGDNTYGHSLIPFWNSLVRFTFFIVISILISIVKNKLDMEEKLADTDYLTGLKNSRAFYEHVESEATRSRRYRRPFTLAYIDLDNFKYVNDTLGHDAGDEALKTIAEAIRDSVRNSDVISRMGGDEFAGLFPETGYEAAESLVKNILSVLKDAMQKNNWLITFSMGAITFVTPLSTAREMIKAADDLMYEVKKKGKNSIIHEQVG